MSLHLSLQPRVEPTFFEPRAPAPPIPLLHIDLLPNGGIRLNGSNVAGSHKFDTLIGFIVSFDLNAPDAYRQRPGQGRRQ